MSTTAQVDIQATRRFTILNVLMDYTGRVLSPDVVELIVHGLWNAIEFGPTAWAFKCNEQKNGDQYE